MKRKFDTCKFSRKRKYTLLQDYTFVLGLGMYLESIGFDIFRHNIEHTNIQSIKKYTRSGAYLYSVTMTNNKNIYGIITN